MITMQRLKRYAIVRQAAFVASLLCVTLVGARLSRSVRQNAVDEHSQRPPRAAYSSRPATSSSPDSNAALSSPARTGRLRWAGLLRRVFAVDVLTCPDCGGARRLIATITDGLVVRRILDHLELPSSPPTITPARAPPELECAW